MTFTETNLVALLAESEAEAEAGLFVSGEDIIRELRESIARMESSDLIAKGGDLDFDR